MDVLKVKEQITGLTEQAAKLNAETTKLQAETAKINREAKWYPAIASAAFIGGVVAVAKLFMST